MRSEKPLLRWPLNNEIGFIQQCLGNLQIDCRGSVEVDCEDELFRIFDGKFTGLLPLQYFVRQHRGLLTADEIIRAVADESAFYHHVLVKYCERKFFPD